MKNQHKSEEERICALEKAIPDIRQSVRKIAVSVDSLQSRLELTANVDQIVSQLKAAISYPIVSSLPRIPEEGALFFGIRAATPIGSPSEQCWQFTIKNKNIKGGKHTAELANDGDCVFLQSGAVEDGEATFVVCCKKQDNGKCKDCTATPQLQVKYGNKFIATKDVSITCRPGG